MVTRLQDKLDNHEYQVICLLSEHSTHWWKLINPAHTDGRESGHDVHAVSEVFEGGLEGYETLSDALSVVTFHDTEDGRELDVVLGDERWYCDSFLQYPSREALLEDIKELYSRGYSEPLRALPEAAHKATHAQVIDALRKIFSDEQIIEQDYTR